MTPADHLILRVFHELGGDPKADVLTTGPVCRRVAERLGLDAPRVWLALLHRAEAES